MRVAHIVADDVEAVRCALTAARAASVVLDAQPLLVDWTGSQVPERVAAMVGAVVRCPTVRTVVVASNAREPAVVWPADAVPAAMVIGAARKPWRTAYTSRLPRPVVVVGDQVLTDGLLAWRIGATFVHWRHHGPVPAWPRIQQLLGRWPRRLVFRAVGKD